MDLRSAEKSIFGASSGPGWSQEWPRDPRTRGFAGEVSLKAPIPGCHIYGDILERTRNKIVAELWLDMKYVRTVCKVKNFEHHFEQNVVMEKCVGFDDSYVGQEDRSV